MGFLDKVKKLGDMVEGAGAVAENFSKTTVEDFGPPAYSLYTAMKLGDINRRIDITDEQGNLKYFTKSSVIAIKGKTDIMDAAGNVIAHLEKSPVSIHEKHFINMADGGKYTLSNEIFHVVKDITNIEGLGWQLQGNAIGLHFNLVDQYGEPVAAVRQKAISIHDRYGIDMYQPDKEQVVVAIVIQLEKMLEARSENESESSFSLFGSGD